MNYKGFKIVAGLTFVALTIQGSIIYGQIFKRDFEHLDSFSSFNTQAYKKIKIFDAWNFLNTRTPSVDKVSIGFIDSGIDSLHPEFSGEKIDTQVIGKVDLGKTSFLDKFPSDEHGTAVAGIIGANNISRFVSLPVNSPHMNGIVSGFTDNYALEMRRSVGIVAYDTLVALNELGTRNIPLVNIGNTVINASALTAEQKQPLEGDI